MAIKILGVCASLRNARWGKGRKYLLDALKNIKTEQELLSYLKEQAELHLQNYMDSGRAKGISFDETYANLKKMKGNKGLSNSEIMLAAALWSARQEGADINHISLSEYFPAAGVAKSTDELKQHILTHDAILLSTPVYFGDRGSLAQEFVDFIRADPELLEAVKAKLYAGLAVGAKRNGGQETTLIYQLLDMIGFGFLGVGNDSETTSQYGGTGHAGDIGTMINDDYGLNTSMGTGRRIAQVSSLLVEGKKGHLKGKVKINYVILKDKDNVAYDFVQNLIKYFEDRIDGQILSLHEQPVARCIACDICPTHIDVDDVYRCIITPSSKDVFGNIHENLLHSDAIIPVVYSSKSHKGTKSSYQKFMERTRYLRRGDYVFDNMMSTALVIEDLGTRDYMDARIITSLIRHHTVIHQPMQACYHKGKMVNYDDILLVMDSFIKQTESLRVGVLSNFYNKSQFHVHKYNPVGYVLSAEKEAEDSKLNKRQEMLETRHRKMLIEASSRLVLDDA